MSGTALTGTIPTSGATPTLVPAPRVGTDRCPDQLIPGKGKRIASRFAEFRFPVVRLIDGALDMRNASSAGHASPMRVQLPKAWSILHELFVDDAASFADHLGLLLAFLDGIGQSNASERVALREYATRMQLYSMLPLYLQADNATIESAIGEASYLACQSLALIDLDRALDGELFELMSEEPFAVQSPPASVESALQINLFELIDAFERQAARPFKEPSFWKQGKPTMARCDGYWSIVQQWSHNATHVRIPPALSIGKILWPRVRDHWSRLSRALIDSDKPSDSAIPDEDIVEIRDANDPQLAETLDLHLQQCREDQSSMAFVLVRLHKNSRPSLETLPHRMPKWQEKVISHLRSAADGQLTRGFLCSTGELALIVDSLERNQVAAFVREALEIAGQPMAEVSRTIEVARLPLVGGIACVANPTKRFHIEQLIQSAWRCLDAAQLQGPGSVKSLEVF